MRPDGMSMLTTRHSDWLMYFTSEAKPPLRGLLSPEPKSPSMTSTDAGSSGGSNSLVTSMKVTPAAPARRSLLALQSAERVPDTLKR